MPHPGEPSVGGHAVCMCGYDDSRRVFIVRNSWGASWGDSVRGGVMVTGLICWGDRVRGV